MPLMQKDVLRRGRANVALLVLLAGSLVSVSAEAKLLYRWLNDQGRQETSHAIPAEMVHRGYEILDGNSMRVLKTVPPQMTPAEYEAKLKREAAVAACEAALDRVNFLYERPKDIDNAEATALRNIDGRIQNAQQNLTNARRKLESLEADAARRERQGSNVTRRQLVEIERANSQIAKLEREITQREAEKDKKRIEYDQERLLFANGSCEGTDLAYR